MRTLPRTRIAPAPGVARSPRSPRVPRIPRVAGVPRSPRGPRVPLLALVVLLALAFGSGPAVAQRAAWRPLRIAKWSVLAASIGSGAYGLWAQREANRAHDRLARICAAEPARCGGTPASDGTYADPVLDRMHRTAIARHDRAVLTMVASQVGLATSIALFFLDMRESDLPPNDLYEPAAFRVGPRPGGGATLRVRLRPSW